MLTNTLFIISTPKNVYLDKIIWILGGLEAAKLTGIQIWIGHFVKYPPLESSIFCFFVGLLCL